MIYMDSHGIRFTLNDFSAPCPLCELGGKKKQRRQDRIAQICNTQMTRPGVVGTCDGWCLGPLKI